MISHDTPHLFPSRSTIGHGAPWAVGSIKSTTAETVTGEARMVLQRDHAQKRRPGGFSFGWIATCLAPVRSIARAIRAVQHRLARPGPMQRGPVEFSTVRVAPAFGPRNYVGTFAALQVPPSSGALLDLVPARLLCADVFARLAELWTAGPEVVPRLGILLTFERWVMLRDVALIALRPISARGVRVDVFYAEQASAGYLGEWFAHGRVLHNVRGAIGTLAAQWHPTASWQIVIDAIRRLAQAHASREELPALLTRAAGLALSCGGAAEAALLAREALYYLPETASATRCQALRELGTALICQEHLQEGVRILDQAFTMAAAAKAPDIGASALCHSGLCALDHGDYAGAERRFRGAIALLSATVHHRHLHALACHSLAVALMHRRQLDDAEHYARAALALRTDPTSHLAEEDRTLLARLHQLRSDVPASTHLVLDSPEVQPSNPEADA